MTNFPVRLFRKYTEGVWNIRRKRKTSAYMIAAAASYLLTVLGFLNQNTIEEIIGSDIDSDMLRLQKRTYHCLAMME